MNQELTPKQTLIYDYICSYIEENHLPPSLRDIGAHFDLSVGAVQDQVNAIRRKGHLEKQKSKARGLRVPMKPNHIPLLGQVHAGPLQMSFENVERYVPGGEKRPGEKFFALRVRGDSMIDAGILEGDLVIVRSQSAAEDGDIVVARVGDETTVKRLRQRNKEIILEPANPRYAPIQNTPFSIAGVVTEVRRTYGRR
ncbi:MAG: transcriptional repressor LexA [Elusimicrobia bacterium]|nr:transcriptional repressor LexA [Candidatus Obscuribacterium magneticum]